MSDPIMFPGNESDHLHLVAGGTAFQRTMAEDTARKAIGTTCGIEIDRSNYWVPELYHKTEGGFELVDVEGIVCTELGLVLGFMKWTNRIRNCII